MHRLKARAEFVAVAKGQRVHRAAFVLQSAPRVAHASDDLPRCGFTVTKKLGKAVVRNRIRRRLREAVRLETKAGLAGRAGHDYVVVARSAALTARFADLRAHLAAAFGAPPRAAGSSLKRQSP
jgi:ribonuclease P protein component